MEAVLCRALPGADPTVAWEHSIKVDRALLSSNLPFEKVDLRTAATDL